MINLMKGEKMKKLLGAIFIAMLGLSFVSTSAFADSAMGQKLYIRKLKRVCAKDGIANGGVLAAKHTQAQWKAIEKAGKLNAEIKKFCPDAKPLRPRFLSNIYDFLYNFASDSGNVPSC